MESPNNREVLSKAKRIAFVVWAPHQARAENLSHNLNAKLYLLHWKFRKKGYAWLKYPLLTIRTLKVLSKDKPHIIFAQMPPVFCPATVLLYCKATGSRLVTDAHTSARIWEVFAPLTKFVMRRSSISLVTNEEVKRRLTSSGIRSFVLEDAIPDLNSNSNVEVFQGSNIAVISTFAKDEPLEEVIRAAGMIPHVNFYVTGNLKFARNEHITNKPRNLFYTDFLDYEKYSSLLNSVDAIMVLTTNDNTMLSGACEAVAVGKPLITSNWSVLVKYFNKGTIHVNNTAEDIVEAVNKAISEKDRLTHEIKELRSLRRKEWNYKFKELLRLLEIR